MNIKIQYLEKNRYWNNPMMIPTGLVLHSTGSPQPKAQSQFAYYNSPTPKASVHAFIDGETGDVLQTWPWEKRAEHAGGAANAYTIGIEMCEPADMRYYSGSATLEYFDRDKCVPVVERAYKTAVKLFALLCEAYNIPPSRIWGHGELKELGLSTSTHVDPEHLWKQLSLPYTMDGFRKDVTDVLNADIRYNSLEEMPTVYAQSVSKLIERGALQGTLAGNLDLSRDMCRMITINDRMGLYGNEKTVETEESPNESAEDSSPSV